MMKNCWWSLLALIFMTMPAMAELPTLQEWIGKKPTDSIENYTLYDHPQVRRGLDKVLGARGSQQFRENNLISAPVEVIDGLIIVMSVDAADSPSRGQALFIQDDKVVGICLFKTTLLALPGQSPENAPFRRDVQYYIVSADDQNSLIDISAYNQKTHCGNLRADQTAIRWLAITMVLLPEKLLVD